MLAWICTKGQNTSISSHGNFPDQTFIPGFDPQPEDVKPNIDIGGRVPPVDATKLEPVKLPQDYMPMLSPLQETSEGVTPYIEAEFGELTASETSRLVAK